MNYTNARTTLATWVSSALLDHPTLPVFWDHAGSIDLARAGDLCLVVEYYWDDAGQITLGENPLHRVTGSVYLTVFAKDGKGDAAMLQLLDTLTESLRFKQSGSLVATVPQPGRRQKVDGWHSQELLWPFSFDSSP